ncbi:MAG: TIGR00701 family protein [Gammaproteobacteria bacterium]|mgnify:CR=1 FL=1|nr:TIGR00701 family protein [Gammaproteobacteria bacterium]MAY03013.1 TIGR00701 family protein [Gammaproteobacteria bacterium]|tara:strand:- start:2239 stop:2667 length:429 start_codon:yes stop_codon:yes gene_type:complete
MLYLWLKALHLFSMVCWFAGIFYLPRLFVYHAMADDEISRDRFKIMERKLFWGIMTPSAVLTVIFGLWLIFTNVAFYMQSGWMHAKLTLVLLLIIFHIMCWRYMLAFREDRNTHSHRFYRWFNEAPVLLLLLIIILVVIKPF